MSRESIANKFGAPMLILNWIFGIGIVEYPAGQQRVIFSFFYNTFCLIAYCCLSWYSYPYLLRMTSNFAVNAKVMRILFYSHAFIIITSIVTGWSRNQGMISINKLIKNADNLLKQIGVPKKCSEKFKMQLLRVTVRIAYILTVVTINSSVILIDKLNALECVDVLIALLNSYPTIVMFIVDATFVDLVILAKEKLKSLNETLKKMSKRTGDYPQHTKIVKLFCQEESEISHDDQSNSSIQEDIIFELKIAKEAHQQLSKLCREINNTFALHVLQSIVIAVGVMTVCLHDIEAMLLENTEISKLQIYKLSIHSTLWITYYGSKIFIFCYVCSDAVEQSIITGDIVSEIYDDPFINKETQAQIRDFNFNLISNSISFNAKGFVTLDLTLITAVIGAIISYVVILTQWQSSIFQICSNSTCV